MSVAIDIGTMNVCSARKTEDGKIIYVKERDVFIELPTESNDAKAFLDMAGAKLVTFNNKNYVVGEEAINFASFLNKEFNRPLKSGLINPQEEDLAIKMLDIIIGGVLGKPKKENELCVYCVPAEPIDEKRNVVYHQKTLDYIVKRHGFTPKAINEATAIIYAELQNNALSGFGISFGAGMVNIACSWKGFPLFSFSIGRSGDWIDAQVSQATGKPASEITVIKETELDLTQEGDNRILRYLKGYYEELIDYLIRNIIKKFEEKKANIKIDKNSKQAEALPIVVAGGTSCPKGFAEMFRDRIEKSDFPFKISKIIVTEDPLYTVAKGCLVVAEKSK